MPSLMSSCTVSAGLFFFNLTMSLCSRLQIRKLKGVSFLVTRIGFFLDELFRGALLWCLCFNVSSIGECLRTIPLAARRLEFTLDPNFFVATASTKLHPTTYFEPTLSKIGIESPRDRIMELAGVTGLKSPESAAGIGSPAAIPQYFTYQSRQCHYIRKPTFELRVRVIGTTAF